MSTTVLGDNARPYLQPQYNQFDFYTSSGEFNLAKFNQVFREEQIKRVDYYRKKDAEDLAKLNKEGPPKKLDQLSIGDHIIGIKNTAFNIIVDLQNEPLTIDIFTKDNRLFYLGLLMLIIFLIYLIFKYVYDNLLIDDDDFENEIKGKIKNIIKDKSYMYSSD
jgi:hypothetical protein